MNRQEVEQRIREVLQQAEATNEERPTRWREAMFIAIALVLAVQGISIAAVYNTSKANVEEVREASVPAYEKPGRLLIWTG